MKIPKTIHILKGTANVLSKTLLASSPEEGCAILIGRETISSDIEGIQLKIDEIWPCCNVWAPGIFNQFGLKNSTDQIDQLNLSRENRFAIDPREHILAQKWARSNNSKVIGIAHSHPHTNGIPSKLDVSLCLNSNLIMIIDNSEKIRAWWITYSKNFHEIEILFCKSMNTLK